MQAISNTGISKADEVGSKPSLAGIIKLISDERTLLIFRTVCLASGETGEELRAQLNLTKKQYYSRISGLTKVGLVNRRKGRHFVTTFGRLCYNAQRVLESAVRNHWRLKAVDSLLEGQNLQDMPRGEGERMVTAMVTNQELRDIILSDRVNC